MVAIWEYDKRPCNGAAFVYFSMKLLSGTRPTFLALTVPLVHDLRTGDSDECKRLVDYMLQVLDAVNIVNSPGTLALYSFSYAQGVLPYTSRFTHLTRAR